MLPLRTVWNEDKIRDLIAGASETGETRVLFDRLDDAEKFRFACYKLRSRKGIGRGYSFVISAAEDGIRFEVQILRTPTFEMVRQQ